MCFNLHYHDDGIMDESVKHAAKEVPVKDKDSWATNFHAAPTQKLPVILTSGQVTGMKFSNNYEHVIIRTESILESKFLTQKFMANRCLIPTYGFFESKKERGKSLPYYCYLKDKSPFFLAGIVSSASNNSEPYFTIITCESNDLINKIHDRMPVIITKEISRPFLYEDQPLDFLEPFPGISMNMHPVSPKINKGIANGPEAIAPFEQQATLF